MENPILKHLKALLYPPEASSGYFGLPSFDVVRFDLVPVLQGQTRIAKLKSAYNSLTIGPRGLQCETNI